MNKTEFLKTLYENLDGFTEDEKREILYDYKEHFFLGKQNGKTEEDIIKELGDPLTIARQYHNKSSNKNSQSFYPNNNYTKNTNGSVILKVLLLIVIIILFAPAILGIFGALIGIIGGAIGIVVGGFGLILGSIFGFASLSLPFTITNVPISALVFMGIGTIALGILIFIGIGYLIRLLCKAVMKLINYLSDSFHNKR